MLCGAGVGSGTGILREARIGGGTWMLRGAGIGGGAGMLGGARTSTSSGNTGIKNLNFLPVAVHSRVLMPFLNISKSYAWNNCGHVVRVVNEIVGIGAKRSRRTPRKNRAYQ